jgi:hypothetical protein
VATTSAPGEPADHEPTAEDLRTYDRLAPSAARPFWNLREDDQRMLYVTIIGGLAANVGLVIIVGLGIAVAHVIHHYEHESWWIWAIAVSQVLGTISALGAQLITRRPSPVGSKVAPRLSTYPAGRVALAGMTLVASILILAAVGYAAGVR